jgi:hypothetical protein
MQQSVSFVLTDAAGLRGAMQPDGIRRLAITGNGELRARLTRIALERLVLSAVTENLGFIAFLQVPADRILVSLVNRPGRTLVWGGTPVGPGRLVTVGPGERVHVRADGAASWGMIWLPLIEFTHYTAALTGQKVTLPGSLAVRRLAQQRDKELHDLHAAATRPILNSSAVLQPDASHGLEQQLIHELIGCLAVPPLNASAHSPPHFIELAARFEEFVLTERNNSRRVSEISRALGVSTRLLQQSCVSQLGMRPSSYLQLCRRDREQQGRSDAGYSANRFSMLPRSHSES